METDWQEVSLGDIFNVKHGFAFKGQFFTDEQKPTILVTPGNFAIGGGFQNPKPKYYDGQIPEEYVLKPGQIIVTMTDLSKQADTLGYAAIVPNDGNIWLHNQRIGLLEFKESFPSDPIFINYLLRMHKYRSWIIGSASGTTVKHTSPSRIHAFKCEVPPIPEQRAIAHILGSLDDKIELNRRMNWTLEATARAIFKSWFVDFDPVRAKVEGRSTGLPDDIAALFPNSLEDSGLGEIPKGWEVGAVFDLANVTSGKRPNKRSKERTAEFSIPLYGGGGVMAYVTEPMITELFLLTGRVGTLGKLFRITEACWPSDNTLLIFPKDKIYLQFLFFMLQRIDFDSLNRGSTQPLLTQTDLKNQSTIIPSKSIMNLFWKNVFPLFEKIDKNTLESNTLASLRDTLLPKLISGELRVTDAEKFVEEANI
jgi:type I restriction enzyme S subunit